MSLFPLFLKLEGRLCLVAGGGAVAAEKIASLEAAGARVRVVAPEAVESIRQRAGAGTLEWRRRGFEPGDLDGAAIAIAATDDRAVNGRVFEEATRRAIWCNTVDDPPLCDFFFGSTVRRGDLQVAISTAGKSPALAQRLRRELDAQLAPDAGQWLDALGELRAEVLATMPAGEERRLLLHELAGRDACEAAECPARQRAREAAKSARERSQ